MSLDTERIRKFLKNNIEVRVFSVIDSTNNEAKRNAEELCGTTVLYAAERQTAGRGRRGRSFYSPDSGLYMTLALPLTGAPDSVQRLTCASAVAVCDAISALTPLSPTVKWVNDIYVGGRKVAGILAELVCDSDNKPISVIIGIGVNLTTDDFPGDFADRAGSIGEVDADRLCARITDNLIKEYEGLSHNSFLEKYIQLNFVLGRRITYRNSSGEHTATAVTIAEDGSLTVEESGVRKALSSAEISIVI